jgi:hypothetical protein
MNNKTFMTGLTFEELDMFFGDAPVPQHLVWKLDREYFDALYGNHDAVVDAEDYFEEDCDVPRIESLIAEEYLEEVMSWKRA